MRRFLAVIDCWTSTFQSTHPLRGATFLCNAGHSAHSEFQSTHPLRGATNGREIPLFTGIFISIHAPLAGCDKYSFRCASRRCRISIHAPLAGCDDTSSACSSTGASNFNPRTPCGVRPGAGQRRHQEHQISIHAPLAGCDSKGARIEHLLVISIHAPLAGCDSKSAQKNAALLRKRYKYKLFVCKKCTSGDLTGAYSSKNTLYSGANCSENPCALSVRTHRISGPSTSNPGLMPKCSILERYFSPR